MTTNGVASPDLLPAMSRRHRPIWIEALFPVDWLALHLSPVYYGFGVPRGHGEAVVLVPGFLGDDRYLTEMHLWLRRIGYKPVLHRHRPQRRLPGPSDPAPRDDHPAGLRGHRSRRFLSSATASAACLRAPPAIASQKWSSRSSRWARRSAVCERTRSCSAPRTSCGRTSSASESTGEEVTSSCFTPECSCEFVTALRDDPPPDDFQRNAIFSKCDGVVAWRVVHRGRSRTQPRSHRHAHRHGLQPRRLPHSREPARRRRRGLDDLLLSVPGPHSASPR